MTIDPYVDPNSGVLLNRLAISDPERLREVEAGLTFAALAELGTRTLPGGYDLAHLRSFHREIFGDLYPWAGEIQVVGIAKTDPFCLPHHIEAYSAEVLGGLAKERYLRGLTRDIFLDRSPTTSPRSTQFTRSVRATAGHSVPSSASSAARPAGPSTGPISTLTPTKPRRWPLCVATTARFVVFSTAWSLAEISCRRGPRCRTQGATSGAVGHAGSAS